VLCHRVNGLWVLCSAEWKGEIGPAFPSAVLSLGSIYRPSYMTQLLVCSGSHALTRSPAAVGQLAEEFKPNITLARMMTYFQRASFTGVAQSSSVTRAPCLHSFFVTNALESLEFFSSSITTHDSGVEPYKLLPSFKVFPVMPGAQILPY
jgi:hypothetical protein